MNWEVVIGLETHTQLSTQSKIFSGASTAFGAEPNSHTAPVDLALPGSLPVLNRGAVERAIRFGLAIGATVAPLSIFARKNYFYPDLPKGYQISQYELPVVVGGTVSFVVESNGNAVMKTINLTRAHLEEDAGKSLHEDFVGLHGEKSTGIDLNRAGTPLLEIVTEPEMRSSAEAVAYAKALHALVMWLGICDGNMQEGSFRCDANVSVRPVGQAGFGTRCEIKNLNSFRFMQQAIDYEIERQIALIEDGGTVIQQTRLFDPDRGETRAMRSKEDAHDYRYFPDPDLPPLTISPEWIARVKAAMPELPSVMRERLIANFGLSAYDAQSLTASKEPAAFFDAVVQTVGAAHAKQAANWIMGDVSAAVNERGGDWSRSPIDAPTLGTLIARVVDGKINLKQGKTLFAELTADPANIAATVDIDALIAARGLEQISDSGALETAIDEILAKSPSQLADYRGGKEKLFGYFVGQAMKVTGGKANPQQLNEMLRKKLAA
ncbi:MAG: Asp-tRNA(Asn)/Glu-tRNA(Gln) amidotransferase subunit GatB [Burkholderiaceae bacterium]